MAAAATTPSTSEPPHEPPRGGMEITRADLEWAVSQGLILEEQVDELWNRLQMRQRDRPRLSSSHVAYYIGAFIVMLGMAWLLGMAWSNQWGGLAVFLIAATYILVFALLGKYLWFHKQKKIPGGLMVTIAVCIVPIAVYGFQLMIGLWYRPPGADPQYYDPFMSDHSVRELLNFLPMEISALIAAAVALKFINFPFLTAVIAFVLWYMTYDWTTSLAGNDYGQWYQQIPFWVSMVYGAVCVGLAYVVEQATRNRETNWTDHTYWIYFVGAFAFWFGLIDLNIRTEWGELLRCFTNVGLIILSVLIKRRIFTVFGVIGITYYLVHLSDLFNDWVLFPFAVTALGAAIIGLGLYRNNADNEEMQRMLIGNSEDQTGTIALEEQFLPEGEGEPHLDGERPKSPVGVDDQEVV